MGPPVCGHAVSWDSCRNSIHEAWGEVVKAVPTQLRCSIPAFKVDTRLILSVANPIRTVRRHLGHRASPGGLQGSWPHPFQPVDPTVDPEGVSRRYWPQSFRTQTNLCLRK